MQEASATTSPNRHRLPIISHHHLCQWSMVTILTGQRCHVFSLLLPPPVVLPLPRCHNASLAVNSIVTRFAFFFFLAPQQTWSCVDKRPVLPATLSIGADILFVCFSCQSRRSRRPKESTPVVTSDHHDSFVTQCQCETDTVDAVV